MLHLEHRHRDGSWGHFEPRSEDHSPPDPERDWANGQIYSCTSCDELLRVTPVEDEVEPAPPRF
jgi:hypothetical protein